MRAGLDIGGANIKVAHAAGEARSIRFEVWRDPDGLVVAIREALAGSPPCRWLGVTTTAELCDCFETKADGVRAVLQAVGDAVAPGVSIEVWNRDGRFVSLRDALADPVPVAAANWLALAFYAARLVDARRALLADLGSTSTDLVPIVGGEPAPSGRTDTERLLSSELVYTGFRRTPVFGLVRELPYRGRSCPVVPELFATTTDVHVLLGNLAGDAGDFATADGRERTVERARERLARTIGADRETFDREDAIAAATTIAAAQRAQLEAAARRVAAGALGGPPETAVVSGEGESWLGEILAALWPACRIVSLRERIGEAPSIAACAHALVELGRDR